MKHCVNVLNLFILLVNFWQSLLSILSLSITKSSNLENMKNSVSVKR